MPINLLVTSNAVFILLMLLINFSVLPPCAIKLKLCEVGIFGRELTLLDKALTIRLKYEQNV